jgi:membrane-bound inhibitor of C-type lysozyme
MGKPHLKPPEFLMHMRHLPALAAGLVLAGCATTRPTTLNNETLVYRCEGPVNVAVTYSGEATGLHGRALLVWDGHSFDLKQETSGSGVRYGDGTLTLFTKGDTAFVEKGGETVLKNCLAKATG